MSQSATAWEVETSAHYAATMFGAMQWKGEGIEVITNLRRLTPKQARDLALMLLRVANQYEEENP